MTKTVLHLVRGDVTPAPVADRDWVVYLHGQTRLAVGGTPYTAPVVADAINTTADANSHDTIPKAAPINP